MDSEFSRLDLISTNKTGEEGKTAEHAVGQRLIVALPFRDVTKKKARRRRCGERRCRRTSGEIRRGRKGKV